VGCSSSPGGGRGRIDAVKEPADLADRGADIQGLLLPDEERLEMIVDDRLGYLGKRLEMGGVEQQGMAPKAGREACDGGGSATEGAGELAVCGAGDETRGDRFDQVGTLQVVDNTERGLDEAPAAGQAPETREGTVVGLAGV
jgi:hypothetical protein